MASSPVSFSPSQASPSKGNPAPYSPQASQSSPITLKEVCIPRHPKKGADDEGCYSPQPKNECSPRSFERGQLAEVGPAKVLQVVSSRPLHSKLSALLSSCTHALEPEGLQSPLQTEADVVDRENDASQLDSRRLNFGTSPNSPASSCTEGETSFEPRSCNSVDGHHRRRKRRESTQRHQKQHINHVEAAYPVQSESENEQAEPAGSSERLADVDDIRTSNKGDRDTCQSKPSLVNLDGRPVEELTELSPLDETEGRSELCEPTLDQVDEQSLESKETSRRRVIRFRRFKKPVAGLFIDKGNQEETVANGEASSSSSESTCTSEWGSSEEEEQGFHTLGRRHRSGRDGNPIASKRRRWIRQFSDISFKYQVESLCGFDDHLHDGFYDAGRDRPFLPLEKLVQEPPSLHTREVILVDSSQDEELDVIAASARQLFQGGEPSLAERARMLALFVSDCFGGSDRTESTVAVRQATIGLRSRPENGLLTRPLAGMSSRRSLTSSSPVSLPSISALCQEAVRQVKALRGSNVVPIGSLPYGICRHRAILFKYLCDRAQPPMPCELVRGYMDGLPHAWNVVQVEARKGGGLQRYLVDACRPLHARPESDPDYVSRYLPLRRFCLPVSQDKADGDLEDSQALVQRPSPSLELLEEIGRGASGAVVYRCKVETQILAAKIIVSRTAGDSPTIPTGLDELRILTSLVPHPNIVHFFGHQISTTSRRCTKHQVVLLTEVISGGSLESLLYNNDSQTPDLAFAIHIATGVARALAALHARGVIHRDVKSSNVLVDEIEDNLSLTTRVKLCDFSSAVWVGSSASLGGEGSKAGVVAGTPPDICIGTPRWMAPEVLRAMYGRHTYGQEADIWSFGCLLLELLTREVPYSELSEDEVHSRLQLGQRPCLPDHLQQKRSKAGLSTPGESSRDASCLDSLVNLFYACTEPSPSERPSAEALVKSLEALQSQVVDNVETPTKVSAVGEADEEKQCGNEGIEDAEPTEDGISEDPTAVEKDED